MLSERGGYRPLKLSNSSLEGEVEPRVHAARDESQRPVRAVHRVQKLCAQLVRPTVLVRIVRDLDKTHHCQK
jgi:hypothetical protein